MNELTIINTNARSLSPKIDSLIDCFSEMKADISIVTETWLRSGTPLDHDLADLEQGAGLVALTRNREPHPTTGVCHGGVAIIYRKVIRKFKEIQFDNPDGFEVMAAVGTIQGISRKLVVVAAYIPPNYSVSRGSACIEHIESLIIEIKRRYRDPLLVLAGDFNQWSV